MIIGIDLDGVILDTEREYRVEAEIYDIDVLKKDSLKNREELQIFQRYDWNSVQQKQFNEVIKKVAKDAPLIPGAKKVINLLKAKGDIFILISSRGGSDEELRDIGMENLKKNGIFLDKYYFGIKDKAKICKEENVEIMIDDNYSNCINLVKTKIPTLYLMDSGMKRIKNNEYIETVYNFGEIYKSIEKRRIAKNKRFFKK